jgi:hypothetical protein
LRRHRLKLDGSLSATRSSRRLVRSGA